MGKLSEYLRSEADLIRAETARKGEELTAWIDALNRLYDQLEEWLMAADGGLGVLSTYRSTSVSPPNRPRPGHYDIPTLRVVLGGEITERVARVVPGARFVAAKIRPPGQELRRADGMVEIRGAGGPEYYLFRLAEKDGDRWYVQSVARWNSDPDYGVVEDLDRDRFEAAILSVLK